MVLDIPLGEHGLIRVFAVNRAILEVTKTIRTDGKAAFVTDLLGMTFADADFELFPASDLSGVGLTGYLSQGYDVPEAQLSKARAKLEALDGYVLLVFSSAFKGKATRLTLGPDLTLIDTFGETLPDRTPLPMESDAAQPYTGIPRDAPALPTPRPALGSWVVAALFLLAAGILWWALR